MIRINLVEGARKRVRSSGSASQLLAAAEGLPVVKLSIGVAVLAVVFVIGHYLYLEHVNTTLHAQLLQEQAEQTRLLAIKKQYDENLARKAELTRRINIIKDLKEQQTGPSQLLAAMASTVMGARQVWLTAVTTKGASVAVEGSALNMDAVANLMTKMLASGYFTDVQLKETEEDTKTIGYRQPPFNFSLTAQPPAPQAPVADTAPAPAKHS
jgi:Tfp pilus assembly protein PilN